MKTKEELKTLKHEYESLSKKLNELTEEELMQVTGGNWNYFTYGQLLELKDLVPCSANDKGDYTFYKDGPSSYNDSQIKND